MAKFIIFLLRQFIYIIPCFSNRYSCLNTILSLINRQLLWEIWFWTSILFEGQALNSLKAVWGRGTRTGWLFYLDKNLKREFWRKWDFVRNYIKHCKYSWIKNSNISICLISLCLQHCFAVYSRWFQNLSLLSLSFQNNGFYFKVVWQFKIMDFFPKVNNWCTKYQVGIVCIRLKYM